jgi:pSer/pThr/pTyr-binding forkhead associated (FHA) protein
MKRSSTRGVCVDQRSARPFWKACGATGPLRLNAAGSLDDDDTGRDLPLPFAVIGRDPKADLRLDHEAVSRRHAYVQVIAGRVFWFDLGSRLGISRGGVVSSSGWLGAGEAIGVGPFQVEAMALAQDSRENEPPNPLTDRGPSSWPDVVLEFRGRPDGPASWRVGRILTLVGRSPDCRLKIPDDGISRFHCALIRTPEGLWVADLLSREGIRVNGARVRFAKVEDGASLHVGRYRMVAKYVNAASSSGEVSAWSIDPIAPDQLPAVAPRRRPPAPTAKASIVERAPSSLTPADLEPFVARFEQMQQQMFEQFHQAMMTMFQTFGAMHREQMGQVREELDRIRELSRELHSLQSGPAEPSQPPPPKPSPRPEGSGRDRPAYPPAGPPKGPTTPTAGAELHDLISQRIARLQDERQGRWRRVLELISGGAEA